MILAPLSRATERKADLRTELEGLGSLARASLRPRSRESIAASSKAVPGVMVSPYLPRIPELPN